MDIILLKDVEHVGLAKSLVSVKAGYARNYLIPQGMAIVANKANKNSLMQEIAQQEERAAKILEEAKVIAEKIVTAPLKIAAKALNENEIATPAKIILTGLISLRVSPNTIAAATKAPSSEKIPYNLPPNLGIDSSQ